MVGHDNSKLYRCALSVADVGGPMTDVGGANLPIGIYTFVLRHFYSQYSQ